MRLIIFAALAFIPLVFSSPVSLGAEFSLPSLENLENHVDKLWENFKKGYGIVHNTTAEEIHRFTIFAKNVKLIIQHNIEHDLGLHTYRLGVNKFAALVRREEEKNKCPNFRFFSRQTKNFVNNSTDINVKNITDRNMQIFAGHTLLLHLTSLCPSRSIGVIKALSQP